MGSTGSMGSRGSMGSTSSRGSMGSTSSMGSTGSMHAYPIHAVVAYSTGNMDSKESTAVVTQGA